MPTRLTSNSVLNSASRNAWRTDGPTEGRCVWEMHSVWGWDKVKNEGVVLQENYFVKDPATGRKVCPLVPLQPTSYRTRNAGQLVYGFLLPIPEALVGAHS